MKEILAVIRMNKTGATKKALVEAGVTGFTAVKVQGRGNLVEDPDLIADRKAKLLAMAADDIGDKADSEELITGFLDGSRLFPRRLFTVMANDEDVPKIVAILMKANRTEYNVGDGKIFIMPVSDIIRVRTGETGDAAL